jgi:hypothetical protein
MSTARVLTWNGSDVPSELRELPAGRYVLESVDEAPVLTAAEEQGLRDALGSLASGRGRSLDDVRRSIDAALRR